MIMGEKNRPNFSEEIRLWKRGYKVVVGLDEAGRGPLAGPITAAAVIVRQFPISNFQFPNKLKAQKIKDSKKLSTRQREEWYKILTTHPDIKWGTGVVSEKIIDKINIFQATKLAMKKAIGDLVRRCYIKNDRELRNIKGTGQVDFIILDGNFILDDVSVNQKAIVKADEKVFSCAAASIIAKVTRDRLMLKYAKKYPEYGFEKHKGYGTKFHCAAIKKHGPCKIHRRSFSPIKGLAKSKFI